MKLNVVMLVVMLVVEEGKVVVDVVMDKMEVVVEVVMEGMEVVMVENTRKTVWKINISSIKCFFVIFLFNFPLLTT